MLINDDKPPTHTFFKQ